MKKILFFSLLTIFQLILVFILLNLPYYKEIGIIKNNIDRTDVLTNNIKTFVVIKGIEINNLLDDNKNVLIGTKINLAKRVLAHVHTKRFIKVTVFYKKNFLFIPIWLLIILINVLFLYYTNEKNTEHLRVFQEFIDGFFIITDKNFNIIYSSIEDLKFNFKNYISLFENLDYGKLKQSAKMKLYEKMTFDEVIFKKRKYKLTTFIAKDGIFFYFKDLTGIIFYQEQIKKSQELSTMGKFSSMVAHELRNPISTIRTSAETILEDTKNKDDIKLLNYIMEESARLSDLIGKMLNFSRELHIDKEYVNIKDFILKIKEDNVQKFSGTTINVKFRSSILFCDIDKVLMANVINNILENAYKAIERKGNKGIIEIITERINEHIVISISNNGEDIVEDKEEIFKPFYTTDTAGFGLGLSIVKKIIDGHNGRIEVESKRNKTIFKIVLRCKK